MDFLLVSLLCVLSASCVMSSSPKTVVQFSRKWDTCDANDHSITEGFTKVIWAHGRLSQSDQPSMHTSRGAKTVRFRGKQDQPDQESDTQTIELKVKNALFNENHGAPGWDGQTNYYCQYMSLPSEVVAEKSHITQYDFVHENGDVGSSQGKVHHVLLYECDSNHNNWGGLCKDPNMPGDCKLHSVGAWALGVGSTIFPVNTGLPMGGSDGFKHVLMELHYDNFDDKAFSDSSGFRLHYTKTLRPQEIGVAMFGSGGKGIEVPAKTSGFEFNFECPGGCTNKLGGDLNVWGTMLHAHQFGNSLTLRQIRDGQELAPLSKESFFDFNLQYINQQSETRTIQKGDSLILNCAYDNPTNKVVEGGEGSAQEMCFAFLYVWPKQNMKGWSCFPSSYKSQWEGNNTYQALTYCPAVNSSQPLPSTCQGSECFTKTALGVVDSSFTEYTAPQCNRPSIPSGKPEIIQDFNVSDFVHTEILNAEDGSDVKLYWSDDKSNEQINFAIEVPSDDGWVGLGWSDQGGMKGADMVMAWIDSDNSIQITDRFASDRALPVVDDMQDFYNVKIFRVEKGDKGSDSSASDTSLSFMVFIMIGVVFVCS